MVSERSSSDYVAGGDKGRAMVSKLLLNSKGIYESTEREVSKDRPVRALIDVVSRFQKRWSRRILQLPTARYVFEGVAYSIAYRDGLDSRHAQAEPEVRKLASTLPRGTRARPAISIEGLQRVDE